ncbi:iron-sulfur cluster biosynthesis family protein, partial [Paenibacillus sp.]|uniref:iron-sulfur cluster biosynthesis family protein n=1 Tax=Paenibacillus sp. TaxID=58172 RepID=UPI002D416C3C
MHITITDAAAARLSGYSLAPGDRFRLVYDAEGCGCAVSGVASLWLTNAPDPDERQAETNDPAVSIFYLQRQVVFFEER